MSVYQTFWLDVFNNTSRTLTFLATGNMYVNGVPQGVFTLSSQAWLSAQFGNAPVALGLLNTWGNIPFQITFPAAGSPAPTGSFLLEFDAAQLTNFAGMAFFGSANDIVNAVITEGNQGGKYIFPLLYMNQEYAGSSLAVLMLVEAAGASNAVNTPYIIS